MCELKGVNNIDAERYSEHIHILLEIFLKTSLSGFIRYLKNKSSLIYMNYFKFRYRIAVNLMLWQLCGYSCKKCNKNP